MSLARGPSDGVHDSLAWITSSLETVIPLAWLGSLPPLSMPVCVKMLIIGSMDRRLSSLARSALRLSSALSSIRDDEGFLSC